MEQEAKQEVGLIEISGVSKQIIFSKLAHFCTNDSGNDLYFLFEAVRELRADVGDQLIDSKYGDKADLVKRKLTELGKQLYKIKLFYDSLGNKELTDFQKEKRIYSLYINELKKIVPLQKTLFAVFNLYIDKTNLKYQSIPSNYFKKSERKYTTFDLGKKEEEEIA